MGNSIGELALKMTLDAQDITNGLKLNRDELKLHRAAMREAMTPADQFAASQRYLSQLMEQNPRNADQYRAALARLEQQYRETQAAASNLTASQRVAMLDASPITAAADDIARRFSPANLAIAGTAVVTASATAAMYGFARETQAAVQRIDATADAAANLGVVPEQFDQLQKAAVLADAPIASVGQLLVHMQDAASKAASGEKAAADAFKQIGIDAAGLRDIAPEQQFARISAAIATVRPDDQIRAMREIFGRGAADAGNLIRNFSDINAQLDQMGVLLRPDQFDAIGAADDATKRLTLQWQAFFDEIATNVAPALAAVTEEITGAVRQTSDGVEQTTTLADALYTVRDVVADVRDYWQGISEFAGAAANVTRMITGPGGMLGRGAREGGGVDAAIAERRAIEQITREENAAAEAAKRRVDQQANAALRRDLIAAEKAEKAEKKPGIVGPDELDRMLQQRRDEVLLMERGKEIAEEEKAIRLGAQEDAINELALLREREAIKRRELEVEASQRAVVLRLLDRAIKAEEALLTPQERLNESVEQYAELVREGLLVEAQAAELVHREAAATKVETSSGIQAMTAGSQAFVAAVAKRDGQTAQLDLQRRAVEELKKLVRKPAAEIVVMKAGA